MSEASRRLKVMPLTRQAFTPYGDVIEASDAAHHFPINGGSTVRYHDLAKLDPGPAGRASLSIFRGQPRILPFKVEMMERHPLASQAFVPLSGTPYLIVVARTGEAPCGASLRAFLARGDQGVNYSPGVWHHPLLALERVSDFLVIDRSGPGQNCDEILLDEAVLLAP